MDMTAEEKAKKYADDVAFLVPYDGTMNFYDEKRLKTAKIDYLAGHTEALRWRDVKEELPPNPNTVFIKYETPQPLVGYGVGRYLDIKGGNPWLTYDCVNREVTHWRPIE